MNALNRGYNYYNELGIASSSTAEEIKEAYRRLAREFHPDVNPSDNARIKFSNVQKAYQVLSDATLRAEYDMQRGILINEEDQNGYLINSQKLREEINYSSETETAYYIKRHSKKAAQSEVVETLKSLIPEALRRETLTTKEWRRKHQVSPATPVKERVYSFSIDEIEALTGTKRTIVLNENGTQVKRELAIPPIDKTEKKLKIKLPKLNGQVGIEEIKMIVTVIPNPNFKRSNYDIYLDVPMLRAELEANLSMTVATTEGFETISLSDKNVKTPLILSSGGLWDKERGLHGDLIIKVTEVDAFGDKAKEIEIKEERERILFMLVPLKRKVL